METKHNLPPEKTLRVVASKEHPTLFKIIFTEGGIVHKALSDNYSRKSYALDAIKKFKDLPKTYIQHVRDKENAQIQDKDRK